MLDRLSRASLLLSNQFEETGISFGLAQLVEAEKRLLEKRTAMDGTEPVEQPPAQAMGRIV
jgi:hypothetical protein